MINKILNIFKSFIKNDNYVVIFVSAVISIIALVYYFNLHLILAYGDAESHINIAKRVVSSITPGFGQLGGNWLPLHHIMMLPFVWNDYLWRSGLAGSFVSMICFVFSALFIFKSIYLVTENRAASYMGTTVFVVNPNILYLQVTPLGELPLIVMFTASVYYFIKWAKENNDLSLVLSAFFSFAGALIRYDAWFLFAIQVAAIIFIGLQRMYKLKKIEGLVILFSTLAFTAILLWVVWNAIIFHDPFYFFSSPYSAKSQQLAWLKRGQLPTNKNLPKSVIFYTIDSVENAGTVAFSLGLIGGMIGFLYILTHFRKSYSVTGLLLYFSPFVFYVVTLYKGISIILLPNLVPKSFQDNLFNARYGIMIVPFVAVFVGYLFYVIPGKLKYLVSVLIGVQLLLFYVTDSNIVLKDGTVGLSARRPSPANQYVLKHYDYGNIMFDDFSRASNPVDIGVPMNRIIYVGNHPMWDISLVHPTKYIRWFVIRHDENDVVWQNLKNNKEFQNNYVGVFNNGKTYVYKRESKV